MITVQFEIVSMKNDSMVTNSNTEISVVGFCLRTNFVAAHTSDENGK